MHRTIREVGLDGTPDTPAYPLPDGRTAIVGVDGGLPRDGPDRRAGPRLYTRSGTPQPTGFSGSLRSDHFRSRFRQRHRVDRRGMPFPPRNRCPLSITDIRTGARRTVLPPPGMVWSSYSDAAFSPDGRQLAAIARPPLNAGRNRKPQNLSRARHRFCDSRAHRRRDRQTNTARHLDVAGRG